MKYFSTENTFNDVLASPQIAPYSRFMIYTPIQNPMQEEANQKPIESIREIGWSPEGVVAGLNFLARSVDEGHVSQYFIYPDAEDQRKNVNLIRVVPETIDPSLPYIVFCAGGAYMSVCTMVEALPSARHFVEAGYQVFFLTYRTMEPGAAVMALNDLETALKFIIAHAAELSIADAGRYVISGFSAGGNLIANWGTPHLGWKSRQMPKPTAMFPIYALTYIDEKEAWNEGGHLLRAMLGGAPVEDYQILNFVDADYPPCYIVCGKDDNTVPPYNSEELERLLKQAGVPVVLEEGEHAQHGFGDGTGTDVEGWPLRAMDFLKALS